MSGNSPLPPASERRAVVIVLDGVGCGELPDAGSYGDAGSNTLGNLARSFPEGLRLPHLGSLGLGRIVDLRGVPPCGASTCRGSFGRCAESAPGKDSTTGHWEMAGVVLERPFPTYPEGFPEEIIAEFSSRIGRGVLGNKAASGTEIIQELGEEHVRTGQPIVYTSVDSVFQIAAHESVISPEELYGICRIARGILQGEHGVGRVIARPFTGESGRFVRTPRRHDFSLPPSGATVLDRFSEAGIRTIGIGKIGDLFAHRGLSEDHPTANNAEGIERSIEKMGSARAPSFIFTNLVEFDQNFGHRKDTAGYRAALEAFDARLPDFFRNEREGDLLIITADHGVDPTTPGTDHTREYTPLLVRGPRLRSGVDLGTRSTFADIGQTLCDFFAVEAVGAGRSFLDLLAD
jgi:phosphopentomutase